MSEIKPENFDAIVDGKQVRLYLLQNKNGLTASITNFGARLVSLEVPDKNGILADVVLGFDNIEAYLQAKELYFGATVGRFANRIAKGKFTFDGKAYILATNNGENHLHGGKKGFNAQVWDAQQVDAQTLQLKYLSADDEEGFPGNLHVKVTYTLNDNNELKIDYEAISDKKTIINLTHHSFFNLSGNVESSINDHVLQINAETFTPIDVKQIPTGELKKVEHTPFDFRTAKAIGKDINEADEQLKFGFGYDHNFVLNKTNAISNELSFAASVVDPKSGRKMEVWTTEPGLQFYGGNFLLGNDIGKQGICYEHRCAFCLETQHFPDSPNQPNFPSTVLEPEGRFYSTTVYRF